MSKELTKTKITSFTDLIVWQKAHILVVSVYDITDRFRAGDRYGLVSQMQRSALSVTSNIAEGFGRQGQKESRNFYTIARGSLVELQNQLLVAKDTNRISARQFSDLADLTLNVKKLLSGLIRSVR